jgi:hypothetical protein
MNRLDIPLNIELLVIKAGIVQLVKPVTSLDIFDGGTKNFHPEGLYSTQIFGVAGTDMRYRKYSWIDLKITILHPVVYFALLQLKSFYGDILSGREFAVFDKAENDFVRADALTGQTGYAFFMDNWKKIVFKQTPSVQREQNIRLMQKYKDNCQLDKIYVLPAGYRDLEIDDSGRESSDEINALYYKLLAISNTISPSVVKESVQAYNSQRMSLQNTYNEIYKTVIGIIEGKNNLMMNKWAARKVFNGTRNVITAMDSSVSKLGHPGNIHFNSSSVGVFQFMKSILPVALYSLKTGFLSEVFVSSSAPVFLVNKKTLRGERVTLSHEIFDRWMTSEGLQKLINAYKEPSLRDQPIEINGYYLGLTYRGPDKTFRLIHGIDEVPQERDASHCTPLTLTELFYTSVYADSSKYPILVTRYPITTDRSTYPSKVHLRSTIKSEVRQELSNDWRSLGPERVAYQFPVRGSDTFNSLSPHSSRLARLNADFDGDTASGIALYSQEAIAEVDTLLKKKEFYVGPDGEFTSNLSTDTITYILHNLTGT